MRGHRFPNRFSKKEYPIAEAAPVGGAAFSYARRQPNPEVRPVRPCAPPCRPLPRRVGKLPHPHGQHRCGAFVRACAEGKNSPTKAEVEGRYSSRIKRGGQAPSPARLTPPRNAGRGTFPRGSEFRPWGLPGGQGEGKAPYGAICTGSRRGYGERKAICSAKRKDQICPAYLTADAGTCERTDAYG